MTRLSMSEGLPKTEVNGKDGEGYPDGINSYVPMTEANLQVGGHRLQFDLEINRLR